MKHSYSKLDAAADSISGNLDKDTIHAVFYTLYFGEDKHLPDSFYTDFVECFVARSTDEDGNEVISQCGLNEALARVAAVTGKATDNITQQQVNELCSVLRFGMASAGDDGNTYMGPVPEHIPMRHLQNLWRRRQNISDTRMCGAAQVPQHHLTAAVLCVGLIRIREYITCREQRRRGYNQCAKFQRQTQNREIWCSLRERDVSSEPVTHIGIYVGENQMLHCGNPIKYASIETDYWSSHFYAMGRLPIGSGE